MKGLGRRLTVLAMMSVVVTAMIGSVYTLWFEELNLNLVASTGTLDGKIICGAAGDNDDVVNEHPVPGYPDPNPGNLAVKDVGAITFSSAAVPPANPDHAWVITVTNAYPGYAIDCMIELQNIGTVPWHIETEAIEIYKNNVLQDFVHDAQCNLVVCFEGDVSPTDGGPAHDPLWVVLKDMRGCQVHPGDPIAGRSTSLHLGVNQSAIESATYQVRVKFQINQWNESGWRSCGDQYGPISLPPQ